MAIAGIVIISATIVATVLFGWILIDDGADVIAFLILTLIAYPVWYQLGKGIASVYQREISEKGDRRG